VSEPTVCAVMLTADRPELARRAVECFRRQTYQAKRLLIINTGPGTILEDETHDMAEPCFVGADALTIGELRNMAMSSTDYRPHNTRREADVIVHWDDDDYSHPNRIAEQVALLQSSGADVVGYREMLFWREARDIGSSGSLDEAWLYSNPDPRYCLGTSLCYWRKTWERKPFEATSQGEDVRFCTGLKCVGVSGINRDEPAGPGLSCQGVDVVPRMIARIHAGNTSTVYRPELMAAIERQGGEWKRSPEWDSYCAEIMS